jgi:hypothetical protein
VYVESDPIQFNDPEGMFLPVPKPTPRPSPVPDPEPLPPPPATPNFPLPLDPPSDFIECNSNGSGGTEKTLNFIAANYADAAVVASKFGIPVAWLLGWSAMETSYGTNSPSRRNNNFFSQEKSVSDPIGDWKGAVVCSALAYVGSAMDNESLNYACFSGFAASADAAMSSRYGTLITTMLALFPSVTIVDVFNAVYAAGWDKSKATTAGNTIQGTQKRITSEIDCLKKYGYI